jgi:hypothetical protein
VLTRVIGVSGTDAWAVGDSQLNVSSGPLRALILHWDGPASNVLNGVSVGSATDACAVEY